MTDTRPTFSKISIIMPLYNVERYLSKALQSLLNQTYQHLEIICVNDGSTDGTLDILNAFAKKDDRIRVITQKNAGVATARNTALDAATGKYIMSCDGDDWYEPVMCAQMLNAIETTDSDVVVCGCTFEFEKSEETEQLTQRRFLHENYYNPDKIPQKNYQINVMLWNKIWKKEIIDRYCIRFPDGHEHDDDAFWFMYGFVADKVYYLKEKLYHYFIRQNSMMDNYFNKKPKNRNDRLSSADYVCDFLIKHNLLSRYEYAMKEIYLMQLNDSCGYFTEQENEKNCLLVNERIKKYFSSNHSFFFFKDGAVFATHKKFCNLLNKLLVSGLKICIKKGRKKEKYIKDFMDSYTLLRLKITGTISQLFNKKNR